VLDLQCLTRLFSLISWPIGASQGSFSAFCKHNIRERSTPGASASYIRCHSSSNRLKAGRPPRDPQWAAGEPQLCRLITLHPHMGKMRACAHMKAHFKSFLTSPHLLGSEQKICWCNLQLNIGPPTGPPLTQHATLVVPAAVGVAGHSMPTQSQPTRDHGVCKACHPWCTTPSAWLYLGSVGCGSGDQAVGTTLAPPARVWCNTVTAN